MVWACPRCNYSNQDDWISCPRCSEPRPQIPPSAPPESRGMPFGSVHSHSQSEWSCAQCTFLNPSARSRCEMCDYRRVQIPPYPGVQSNPVYNTYTQPAPPAGWSPDIAPDTESRIVVLGRTGSGKSTTCNNILQAVVFKSDTCGKSVTIKCQRATCNRFGRNIQLIDTPGLFDTGMSNAETTREIVKCVGMTAPGPHAFLLITRIDRFTKEEQDTVEHFKNVFGPGMMRHLIVLFTRKDDLNYEGKTIHQFVENVPSSMKELLYNCGNRYIAFNNRGSPEEKNRDVQELVNLIDNIVLNNGGGCYTTEMYEEAEKIMKKREEQLKKEHEAKANKEKLQIQQQFEGKMREMERQQQQKLVRLQEEVRRREQDQANQHEREKLKLEVEAEKLKMEKELEVARREAELAAHKKQQEVDQVKPNYREEAREEVNRGKDVAIDILKMGLEAVFREGVSILFGMAKDSWSKNRTLKESHGPSSSSTKSSSTKAEGNMTDEAKTSKKVDD